jgi:hypothetical protein
MKNEIKQLIDRLADKNNHANYDFIGMIRNYVCLEDWINECPDNNAFLEACHIAIPVPVIIGDVLNSPEVCVCFDEEERKDKVYEIWSLWYECGLTKSLQELYETEWAKIYIDDMTKTQQYKEYPKDPNIRKLFEFLIELGL